MEKLSGYIEKLKIEFAGHPLFSSIKDLDAPLPVKLSFLPQMAYFIMSFGDLNKYVLPFNENVTPLEDAVNTHAKEDELHWLWYLSDLETLGMNALTSFTDNLRYIWSEKLSPSRKLTYELIRLVAGQPASIRLAVIEVMEAAGNVFLLRLLRFPVKIMLKQSQN